MFICPYCLSQISNCQSLGRNNKHEILKTDRTTRNKHDNNDNDNDNTTNSNNSDNNNDKHAHRSQG